MEFVDLPVRLRADTTNDIEGIGIFVARSSAGRYYTYTERGTVSVWEPDGTFARSLGRTGSGPGEFARGQLRIHIDPAGRVNVHDNSQKWSVFSAAADHGLISTRAVTGIGASIGESTFLGDGSFLSAEPTAATEYFFHVYDVSPNARASTPDGFRVRSFGHVSDDERVLAPSARRRRISRVAADTFWAGPPTEAGRGYELEEWRADGTRARTLRRNASWFPKSEPRVGRQSVAAPPPTQITILHYAEGLLIVCVASPNERYPQRSTGTFAEREAARNAGIDIYYEVIDVASATVIASLGRVPRTEIEGRRVPHAFFPGSRHGYRRVQLPDGGIAVQLTELRLVAQ